MSRAARQGNDNRKYSADTSIVLDIIFLPETLDVYFDVGRWLFQVTYFNRYRTQ